MARARGLFDPRLLLGMLAAGALALLILLYAIGAGLNGRQDQNGGSHAAANGLNGFAGLARLLEARGRDVALSRSEGRLDDTALLIVTPQFGADPDKLAELIESRRYVGPTLVIMPKWFALPTEQMQLPGARPGFVQLAEAMAPDWIGEMAGLEGTTVRLAQAPRWQGMGGSGALPDPDRVASLTGGPLVPLISAGRGTLAGYWQDDGYYPRLEEAAEVAGDEGSRTDQDTEKWAVVFVAEPDLLNNYGLADQQRARAAVALVEAAMEGDDSLPIIFDLTLAGLGRSENLLTLAFEPPFLAATLCLLLAALVVAWRALRRFGPPQAEAGIGRMGKRQLVINGAALVQRARRWHLLGPPYAALVSARIARRLALRPGDDGPLLAALARRGLAEDYQTNIGLLRRASTPTDLLGAAAALRTIERTLTP
jgi:hypothetical protein